MKKKITFVSLVVGMLIAVIGFNLNFVFAEDTIKDDEIVSIENPELSAILGDASPGSAGMSQECPPLSQEEYDDLINSLPEGAVLVGDVKVLPGVVKDSSKEKPYPSSTDSSEK
jgi:hypothetical protein